eukprot:TRINITY_DN7826_c0_g1_i2.p1 TRINITY_DN7826_c0_g1~~TRINITY_DN7826_c0_g1_i2.p1  ORF type:complete len:1367 (-),score=208.69 TRINITY_DN7826_c0_g1_i2:16-4032(-)
MWGVYGVNPWEMRINIVGRERNNVFVIAADDVDAHGQRRVTLGSYNRALNVYTHHAHLPLSVICVTSASVAEDHSAIGYTVMRETSPGAPNPYEHETFVLALDAHYSHVPVSMGPPTFEFQQLHFIPNDMPQVRHNISLSSPGGSSPLSGSSWRTASSSPASTSARASLAPLTLTMLYAVGEQSLQLFSWFREFQLKATALNPHTLSTQLTAVVPPPVQSVKLAAKFLWYEWDPERQQLCYILPISRESIEAGPGHDTCIFYSYKFEQRQHKLKMQLPLQIPIPVGISPPIRTSNQPQAPVRHESAPPDLHDHPPPDLSLEDGEPSDPEDADVDETVLVSLRAHGGLPVQKLCFRVVPLRAGHLCLCFLSQEFYLDAAQISPVPSRTSLSSASPAPNLSGSSSQSSLSSLSAPAPPIAVAPPVTADHFNASDPIEDRPRAYSSLSNASTCPPALRVHLIFPAQGILTRIHIPLPRQIVQNVPQSAWNSLLAVSSIADLVFVDLPGYYLQFFDAGPLHHCTDSLLFLGPQHAAPLPSPQPQTTPVSPSASAVGGRPQSLQLPRSPNRSPGPTSTTVLLKQPVVAASPVAPGLQESSESAAANSVPRKIPRARPHSESAVGSPGLAVSPSLPPLPPKRSSAENITPSRGMSPVSPPGGVFSAPLEDPRPQRAGTESWAPRPFALTCFTVTPYETTALSTSDQRGHFVYDHISGSVYEFRINRVSFLCGLTKEESIAPGTSCVSSSVDLPAALVALHLSSSHFCDPELSGQIVRTLFSHKHAADTLTPEFFIEYITASAFVEAVRSNAIPPPTMAALPATSLPLISFERRQKRTDENELIAIKTVQIPTKHRTLTEHLPLSQDPTLFRQLSSELIRLFSTPEPSTPSHPTPGPATGRQHASLARRSLFFSSSSSSPGGSPAGSATVGPHRGHPQNISTPPQAAGVANQRGLTAPRFSVNFSAPGETRTPERQESRRSGDLKQFLSKIFADTPETGGSLPASPASVTQSHLSERKLFHDAVTRHVFAHSASQRRISFTLPSMSGPLVGPNALSPTLLAQSLSSTSLSSNSPGAAALPTVLNVPEKLKLATATYTVAHLHASYLLVSLVLRVAAEHPGDQTMFVLENLLVALQETHSTVPAELSQTVSQLCIRSHNLPLLLSYLERRVIPATEAVLNVVQFLNDQRLMQPEWMKSQRPRRPANQPGGWGWCHAGSDSAAQAAQESEHLRMHVALMLPTRDQTAALLRDSLPLAEYLAAKLPSSMFAARATVEEEGVDLDASFDGFAEPFGASGGSPVTPTRSHSVRHENPLDLGTFLPAAVFLNRACALPNNPDSDTILAHVK